MHSAFVAYRDSSQGKSLCQVGGSRDQEAEASEGGFVGRRNLPSDCSERRCKRRRCSVGQRQGSLRGPLHLLTVRAVLHVCPKDRFVCVLNATNTPMIIVALRKLGMLPSRKLRKKVWPSVPGSTTCGTRTCRGCCRQGSTCTNFKSIWATIHHHDADRYSHLLPEGLRDTTAAMERAFEAASGEDRGRRAVWPWASSCLGRLVNLFRPPDRPVGNAVTQWA